MDRIVSLLSFSNFFRILHHLKCIVIDSWLSLCRFAVFLYALLLFSTLLFGVQQRSFLKIDYLNSCLFFLFVLLFFGSKLFCFYLLYDCILSFGIGDQLIAAQQALDSMDEADFGWRSGRDGSGFDNVGEGIV